MEKGLGLEIMGVFTSLDNGPATTDLTPNLRRY
jgi:hypothetical protein